MGVGHFCDLCAGTGSEAERNKRGKVLKAHFGNCSQKALFCVAFYKVELSLPFIQNSSGT